jgi:TonB family protein
VVVYVTIDSNGNVLTAKVDLDGTTTSDETLRRLAIEAARKAKFKPSQRTEQGGRITYDFKLQ